MTPPALQIREDIR